MVKYLYAGIGLIAMTAPALAQEFYVVRESEGLPCAISETRPADGAIIIGDGFLTSRAEAESRMEEMCDETAMVVDDDSDVVVIDEDELD